jgi:malate dehydrogenase (oxaloacetate-decarboxylating)
VLNGRRRSGHRCSRSRSAQLEEIVAAIRRVTAIEVVHFSDRTFLMHLGGKIEVVPEVPVKTRDDLSMAYTPGVARATVSRSMSVVP